MGNHAQVVRDQDQAHAAFLDEIADQLKDLTCHRHIERGGGLVGNQQVRIASQCHGNGDALALPTRELVRVGIHAPGRIRDAHSVEQAQGLCTRIGSGQAFV